MRSRSVERPIAKRLVTLWQIGAAHGSCSLPLNWCARPAVLRGWRLALIDARSSSILEHGRDRENSPFCPIVDLPVPVKECELRLRSRSLST